MIGNREIDALVAEKVMKEKIITNRDMYTDKLLSITGIDPETKILMSTEEDIPHYSTDIAAAWECFIKASDGVCGNFYVERIEGPLTSEYRCMLDTEDGRTEMSALTAPMAIALAALKAVGEEI